MKQQYCLFRQSNMSIGSLLKLFQYNELINRKYMTLCLVTRASDLFLIIYFPEMALENLCQILKAGGSCMENVVTTTILLTEMNDFVGVNDVYGRFFKRDHPARSAYQVVKLPMNAKVAVSAIAITGDVKTL